MAPQYRTVTSRKAALILAEVALFLPQRVEKYTASAFHLNSLEKMPASRKSLSVLFLLSCRLKALSFSITKQSSKKIVRDKKIYAAAKRIVSLPQCIFMILVAIITKVRPRQDRSL